MQWKKRRKTYSKSKDERQHEINISTEKYENWRSLKKSDLKRKERPSTMDTQQRPRARSISVVDLAIMLYRHCNERLWLEPSIIWILSRSTWTLAAAKLVHNSPLLYRYTDFNWTTTKKSSFYQQWICKFNLHVVFCRVRTTVKLFFICVANRLRYVSDSDLVILLRIACARYTKQLITLLGLKSEKLIGL